jgi:hypothetical protein
MLCFSLGRNKVMTLNALFALALFSLSIIAPPVFAQTLLRVATPGALVAVKSQVLRTNDAESLDYSYHMTIADARPDLFPTEEAVVNVLTTMSYEGPAFASISLYNFFDLSLIQELKSESR